MSAAASAGTADRARGRFWFDPRFAIGLLLIMLSVVGVSVVIQAADRTTVVYAARGVIARGSIVHSADLVPMRVRLGDSARRYVTSSRLPASGLIASRSIGDGELVPASAVGVAGQRSTTSVVIPVRGGLAASVVGGAVVDVWSAPRTEASRFGAPSVIVSRATVLRSLARSGLVTDRDTSSLEVRVPKNRVAAVLEARANGDELSIVPADVPLGR